MQKGNPLPGWFRRMGGSPIRLAVVTHSHIDHFGGLISLCNEDGQRIDSIAVLKDAGLERQSQLLMALQTRKSMGTALRLIDKAQTLYVDAVLRLRIVHPRDITEKSKLPMDVNKTSMIITANTNDNEGELNHRALESGSRRYLWYNIAEFGTERGCFGKFYEELGKWLRR